jgi:hypothetical protein
MPPGPVFVSRTLTSITLLSGNGAVSLTEPVRGGHNIIGVNVGNKGSDREPPTLSYINQVDDTETQNTNSLGDRIAALLPLSDESVFVPGGQGFLQYRHPRWSKY